MVETYRTLIYRLGLLALIVFIVFRRPDTVDEILPVLLALLGHGVATAYTRLPK